MKRLVQFDPASFGEVVGGVANGAADRSTSGIVDGKTLTTALCASLVKVQLRGRCWVAKYSLPSLLWVAGDIYYFL